MMILIIFLPFLLFGVTEATIPSYNCRLMYGSCTLSGIEVTAEHPEFTINYDSPHPIESIQIEDSSMPVLTSQICDAFPNIFTLNFKNAGLVEIKPDALKTCSSSLKGLQMWDNPIKSLDKDLFQYSTELKHLAITNSSLTHLEIGVFSYLKELVYLQLSNNHLVYDNPNAFKGLDKLEELQLYSNELLDMDESKFLMYLPKLKKIYLNDNDFLCDRLVQIIAEFKSKGVQVDTVTKTLRSRSISTGNEEGNICIASQEDYLGIVQTKKDQIPPVSPHHQFP